jgi:hypothetical protein
MSLMSRLLVAVAGSCLTSVQLLGDVSRCHITSGLSSPVTAKVSVVGRVDTRYATEDHRNNAAVSRVRGIVRLLVFDLGSASGRAAVGGHCYGESWDECDSGGKADRDQTAVRPAVGRELGGHVTFLSVVGVGERGCRSSGG